MSAALTVQPRHLTLPECCLFAPTELQIGPALSQTEFSRLGKALSSVDQASDLWACDYALAGQKRWGVDGLKLAHEATKLSIGYLKVGARIAERFDPSRRFPNLTRHHYRCLVPFPVEFTDAWLPTVIDRNLSAKLLRAVAVEAYGSDPCKCRAQNEHRTVLIRQVLYARLKELSPIPKTAVFIEEVLEDWLSTATPEMQTRVAAAIITREETWHQQRRVARNAKKAEKLAAKAAARDKRDVEQLAQKAERQAFYEAERVEREAERASAVAAKAKKKAVAHCAKIAKFTERQGKPSQWATKSEADEVAARFSEGKSYSLESYACDCGQFHIRRAVGACPSDGKSSDDTSPSSQTGAPTETLPTWNWGHVKRASAPAWDSSDEGPDRLPYDQRRAAQIAAGAGEPIPVKERTT